MNKERFVYPRYGDSDYVPWGSRIFTKREIKRLHKKIRTLERDLEYVQNARNQNLDFEYEFRRFLNRFKKREYKSEWPFERFLEALTNLEEKLS